MLDLIDNAHRKHDRWRARTEAREGVSQLIPRHGGEIVEADGRKFIVLRNCNGIVAIYLIDKGGRLSMATDEEWNLVTTEGELLLEA